MQVSTIILDDVRSAHNVGSILRTADGFGVTRVISCGITPYLRQKHDTRLPHIIDKTSRMISKTALDAQKTVDNTFTNSVVDAIQQLQHEGHTVIAIEQDKDAVAISESNPKGQVALVMGNEVDGVCKEALSIVDQIAVIPMVGSKESFNVSVTAGIALYAYLHD